MRLAKKGEYNEAKIYTNNRKHNQHEHLCYARLKANNKIF